MINSRPRAFTFTELLLVILILSLVMSVSATYFAGTYKKASLNNTTGKLLLMGKYARMYAVENNRRCRINLDREQNQFYLTTMTHSQNGTTNTKLINNQYCRTAKLKKGIRFEQIEINSATENREPEYNTGNCIAFYPDGSCDAAVIQFGNGRHSATTVFSSAHSQINIHEGAADTVKDRLQAIDLDATD